MGGGEGVSTAVKKPKGFLFIFRGGRGSSIQRGWVFLKKYYEKENFVRSTLSSGYTTILVIVYLTAEVIFKKLGFFGGGGGGWYFWLVLTATFVLLHNQEKSQTP